MLTDEATRLVAEETRFAAEETRLRSRRNAEGAETRGLKRQTGGADGRSNAVGSRRNAPAAERRSAWLSGRQRTAVSRRQLAAPAPLLSIINLARALFPTAGAFSLCSPPRLLQWHNSSPARPLTATCAPSPTRPPLLLLAHHLPSRYTAFLLLLRTTAARSVYSYLQGK